ncbi:MAG: response regulator transcription factor [Burkholderiales bacterium]
MNVAASPVAPAILVADDHDLVRIGLCQLLRQWNPDVVLAEAADGRQLADLLVGERRWDLMLIDLAMPDFGGEGDVRELLLRHPRVPVLVVSGTGDPGKMTRLLDAGVAGFLPKSLDGRLMVKAIELVLAGGRYVPPEALGAGVPTLPGRREVEGPEADGADITPRQREILALLLQGLPNKVIAARLAIAEATVKMHVTALFKSHGVQSRAELMAKLR